MAFLGIEHEFKGSPNGKPSRREESVKLVEGDRSQGSLRSRGHAKQTLLSGGHL